MSAVLPAALGVLVGLFVLLLPGGPDEVDGSGSVVVAVELGAGGSVGPAVGSGSVVALTVPPGDPDVGLPAVELGAEDDAEAGVEPPSPATVRQSLLTGSWVHSTFIDVVGMSPEDSGWSRH